jgi:leucyl aminopeptidase
MNFELKHLGLVGVANEKCDALLILVADGFKPAKDDLSALIAQTTKAGDFESKAGKTLLLYRPSQANALRVVLAGVGEGGAKQVRTAVTAALALVKSASLKKLTVCFAHPALDGAVRAAVLSVADTTYVYTTTKSKAEGRVVQKVTVATTNAAELQSTFERTVATVAGVEVAKEWANRPANYATPTHLAKAAEALAKQPKFSCEVLGPKEVAKLGMGSFMAVAQGSDEPLRFIVLRYSGAAKTQAPTVLVGKGITFDSGGISIKPAAEMDEMKFDMSGAASVLGGAHTFVRKPDQWPGSQAG